MSTENEKISELYQSIESVEPPAHLDENILAASRKAIKHKSHSRGPFSGGWPVIASVAALVLITVVIVPVTMREIPDNEHTPQSSTGFMNSPDKMLVPKKKAKQFSDRNEPKSVTEKEIHRLTNEIKPESPALAFSPQPVIHEEKLQLEQHAAESTSASGLTGIGAFSDKKILHRAATGDQLAKQTASDKPVLTEKLEEHTNKRARTLVAKEPVATNRIAGSVMSAKHGKITRTANEWLETIKQLLDNNKTDEAKKEFEDFKKAYPDYTVNEKLLDRLKKLSDDKR